MPRRAGDARSEGKPGLCLRWPADTRMPGSIATGTGVFSESVARAAEAMRPGAARAALVAAPLVRSAVKDEVAMVGTRPTRHHPSEDNARASVRRVLRETPTAGGGKSPRDPADHDVRGGLPLHPASLEEVGKKNPAEREQC